MDGGETPRRNSVRLFLTVMPREVAIFGNSPPRFISRVFEETIPENDVPGQGLIVLLEAEDADHDRLRFAIIGEYSDSCSQQLLLQAVDRR